jgi:HD-like signal output (HDOD) protein
MGTSNTQEKDPVGELIKSIRIPPRPSLLLELQQELANTEPSPRRIASIIASDVGMSGALLKLANSPFYALRRKATSIEQAITILGMNQCIALMTGFMARQAITSGGPNLDQFWDESAMRAKAMVYLAYKTRACPPDIAHTFGLFCNIGVPLLMGRFPIMATRTRWPPRTSSAPSPRSRMRATPPITRRSAVCWRATGACPRTSRGRSCCITTTR